MDDDEFDAVVSALALPFVVGMALGIGIGRLIAGSLIVGVVVGLVLAALFGWIRLKLATLPS